MHSLFALGQLRPYVTPSRTLHERPSKLRVSESCLVYVSSLTVSMLRGPRRSHSRPEEVPLSERNRMLQRPQQEFASPTGRRPDEELYFVLTPCDPEKMPTPGRVRSRGKTRWWLKSAGSSQQLLYRFREALKGQVDGSLAAPYRDVVRASGGML